MISLCNEIASPINMSKPLEQGEQAGGKAPSTRRIPSRVGTRTVDQSASTKASTLSSDRFYTSAFPGGRLPPPGYSAPGDPLNPAMAKRFELLDGDTVIAGSDSSGDSSDDVPIEIQAQPVGDLQEGLAEAATGGGPQLTATAPVRFKIDTSSSERREPKKAGGRGQGGGPAQNKKRESSSDPQSFWTAKPPPPLPARVLPPGGLRVVNNPSGSGVDTTPLPLNFAYGKPRPPDRYDPNKPYPVGEINSDDLKIFRKHPNDPDQRPYQKRGPTDPLEVETQLRALEADAAARGVPKYPDSSSTSPDSPDSWGPHGETYRYYGKDNPLKYSNPPQIFADDAEIGKGFVPYPTTGRDPRKHPFVVRIGPNPTIQVRPPVKHGRHPNLPDALELAPTDVQDHFIHLMEQMAEREILKVRQEMDIDRVFREQEHRMAVERMKREKKDLAKQLSERHHAQYDQAMQRAEQDRKGLIDQLAAKITEKDGNNREVARLIQAELTLKTKLELCETERQEAVQKNEDQQIKIRDLNVQLGGKRVDLNRQIERTNHAQERVVELIKERGERDTKIARLEKQRKANDVKGQDVEIKSTREENEKLQKKLTVLEKKSNDEAHQMALLRQALDAAAQNELEMRAVMNDADIRCEKLHETTSGLRDDIAAVKVQKANLVDEKKRYAATIRASKEKIVSLEQRIKTFEEEAVDLKELIKSFEERAKELEAQLKSLEESTDSSQHFKALQGKIGDLEDSMKPLKAENKAAAREIDSLKETVKTMGVNEEVLQANLKSNELQAKTLEKKVKSLEREAKDLKLSHANEIKSHQETEKLLKDETESANAQVAILEEQLALYQKQQPDSPDESIDALKEQLHVAMNAKQYAEEQWALNYDQLVILIKMNDELQRTLEDVNKAAAIQTIRNGTLKRHTNLDMKSENTDLEERAFVQLEVNILHSFSAPDHFTLSLRASYPCQKGTTLKISNLSLRFILFHY